MNKFLLTIAILTVVLVSCGQADNNKIVFASDCTWPPMEFIDAQGKLVGFDVDLVDAIAKAANFEYEIRNVAWDGIFAGLANNQYSAVISSVTITDERKQSMDFSIPYLNAGQVIVVRKGTQGEKLGDFIGKNVGAQIGTTGAIEVSKVQGVNLKGFDEIGLAFEALINGVIDAVICDSPVAADFALQRAEYKDKLTIASNLLTEEFYGIAVNKGNTKVLSKINEGLTKVLADGTIDQLKAKWGLK